MPGFSKEMQDALRADAEKLSAMTGEEHTVEFFSTPWDGEPVAWRVIPEPNFRPFHCSKKADAEQVAHNYLTYVKGCTGAIIEPLYAGPSERIHPRTYGTNTPSE
ncbi:MULTISPECIES: hypothetical protein [unclassified Mesorhizobium]|uniref:hypothetical protein n=1 Tax=unclassified Mesorhizobium TaxID=325217 RepID=UPI000FC9FD01|nr:MULTISPECIES: hypothetical protein [unclassified Mesorhizobium]TGT97586.1 hypothetical protein EN806_48695 [bacterium M00.F.Ca.ET.163.01.1.1]TGU44651.1 hypothetical protein EN789_21860 [bacterium M00.F.Ca.ET.146.01.1.1]TGW09987.1 hypothetical protein EN788_22310 [Mesorhizobium sp. M2D.F.Ca.ET.145.01.1.1]TGP34044.1 hypothetical protein EN875_012400 [Mesorhizobium sp. M2D.F.Ca.ET.232.01.1.1]TGQ44075.1 hypothetical protein EN863_014595 [Mesorhizobium sp. M00.F.Ca.ET.220.01.1.1]